MAACVSASSPLRARQLPPLPGEGRLAAESKVGVTSSALWMRFSCQY